jgi:predicted phosphodiesterase
VVVRRPPLAVGEQARPGSTGSARRWVIRALVVAVGAVASLATLGMASPVQASVGPGTVEVGAASVVHGSTTVALPPLGRIVASTHRAPVRLGVRLDELDVERLQALLSAPRAQERITDAVRADLPDLLQRFVVRSLLAALLVGGVAGALVPRRRLLHAALGAAGGLVGVGLVLVWTWQGYDTEAFEEARFEGALERAPAILEAAQRSVGDLDRVSGLVQTLSGQVAGLYAATDLGGATGETLILHVSDIHSNPLGVELVEQLADSFDVDAVLDTGDLTSYGSPVESRISGLIEDIDVPYLLVPGNHDSEENRAAFEASTGITVLDGTEARVGAVRILGIGDPTFTADNRVSTATANERKEELSPRVLAAVRRSEPDLLAVHDVRQAEDVAGSVPVVVAGHTHARGSRSEEGTTFLTVGSTGATGLGSFLVETTLPYEAQILRFDGRRLAAVDYVTLEGVAGDFTIDRQVVVDPDAEDRGGGDREERDGDGGAGGGGEDGDAERGSGADADGDRDGG